VSRYFHDSDDLVAIPLLLGYLVPCAAVILTPQRKGFLLMLVRLLDGYYDYYIESSTEGTASSPLSLLKSTCSCLFNHLTFVGSVVLFS
jgi:hypothetical protein